MWVLTNNALKLAINFGSCQCIELGSDLSFLGCANSWLKKGQVICWRKQPALLKRMGLTRLWQFFQISWNFNARKQTVKVHKIPNFTEGFLK